MITSHKDYQLLKLKSISDVKDKFTFLNINEKEVSLITMDQLKKISNEATPLIYQVSGIKINFLKFNRFILMFIYIIKIKLQF